MALGDRVKMPGLPGVGGDELPAPEEEVDPVFEDAITEAFPDMAGDTVRIAALERAIRAASRPKGVGLVIGIGKEKPRK